MFSDHLFAKFDGSVALPLLLEQLFEEQCLHWKELRTAIERLSTVQTRTIDCETFSVLLQWNPKRLQNVQANVTPEALRQRSCCLCMENLPEEQKGILYKDTLFILCNPSPIFPHHATVVHTQHFPQEFFPYLEFMISLAEEADNAYTLLYNGPQCGASAPDHFHFQLIPWRSLPVETDAVEPQRRKLLHYQPHLSVSTLQHYCRAVLIVESDQRKEMLSGVEKILNALKKRKQQTEEPMLNALCSYQQEVWRLILFLRRKHRPDRFYATGDEQILISPGVIDMGGVLITPREREFKNFTPHQVMDLYHEMSESEEYLQETMAEVQW